MNHVTRERRTPRRMMAILATVALTCGLFVITASAATRGPLTLTPSSGDIAPGGSLSVVVKNTDPKKSTSALTATVTLSPSNAPFSITNLCQGVALGRGKTCTVKIAYTSANAPAADQTATLTVQSKKPGVVGTQSGVYTVRNAFGTGVFNGELDASDPVGTRATLGIGDVCIPFSGWLTHYDTYTVALPQAATLSVAMQGQFSQNGSLVDPYLVVYAGSPGYDPNNPCTNFVGLNDDVSLGGIGGFNPDSALSIAVPAGTYTVVATTYYASDEDPGFCCGTYTLTIGT